MAGYGGKSGGGNYPIALAGGQSPQMGQTGMQPYSGGMGKGYDGLAVIVQTTKGTYSFFVGADGRAGMNVPGASFMYMPNSALGGGNSLDGLLGKGYNANKGGRLENGLDKGMFYGPGMGGYDPLKNQMPNLKDFGEADYKMRDPNYASSRIPEKREDYMNAAGSQKGLMRQAPKARYDEMGKQAKETTADNYGYSSAGRTQQKKDNNNSEPQMREPSQLERVAMGIPIDGYETLPLGA
jgi:hypothetical protein